MGQFDDTVQDLWNRNAFVAPEHGEKYLRVLAGIRVAVDAFLGEDFPQGADTHHVIARTPQEMVAAQETVLEEILLHKIAVQDGLPDKTHVGFPQIAGAASGNLVPGVCLEDGFSHHAQHGLAPEEIVAVRPDEKFAGDMGKGEVDRRGGAFADAEEQ